MIDQSSFRTSADNMAYDETLFNTLQQTDKRFFRIYLWDFVGLTQSEKRLIPDDLLCFDYSYRLTGGGVVFHSPGDLVFSIGGSLSDSFFPNKSKDLLNWCSDIFAQSLLDLGIPVHKKTDLDIVKNINFCASYFNPYELYVGDAKVFGFALKKTRKHFLIQGVLHIKSSDLFYKSIADRYNSFFTKGMSTLLDINQFVSSFKSILISRCDNMSHLH